MKRREFLKATALATGSYALIGGCKATHPTAGAPVVPAAAPGPDASLRELANVALDAARAAGATYADVRIADYRRQHVFTRERRVIGLADNEDRGFGVRVIANGTWGFAASPDVDREEIARIARKAVAIAKANSRLQREPIKLAPIDAYDTVWNTPIRVDPFSIPLAAKVERLLAINAEAMDREGVQFCTSSMSFVREHKFFASTEGSYIEQTLHRNDAGFNVTSIDRKQNSFQSRNSYSSPKATGYEYIEEYPWTEDVRQAAEEVAAMHSAKSVEPGKRDLILLPSHLWLTIHESIGHPTELDRAMGMEANYAGTSFLTPDKLGKFRIGSDIVNFVAEKTAPQSLATSGYDDDGDRCTQWDLVKDGMFVDYQFTRDQAHWLGRDRSNACCYAQSWKDVPFQRMPNVNLVPGKDGLSLADLIASTDDAILIKGNGSYSIDHQRYNFQFGGQAFYEVKGGKVGGLLKDVAYQARTPDFWQACDAICGPAEYQVGGSSNDGKGEPSQSNAVSHGCAPARFRKINILNTSRQV